LLSVIKALTVAAMLSATPSPEWVTIEEGPFDILYLPKTEYLAKKLAPLMGPELDRISGMLQTEPMKGPITVVIAPDNQSFMELQKGGVSPWVSGTAYPDRRLIYLRPLTGNEVRHSSVESVASHEIAHLVLHEKVKGGDIPTWLHEGTAVFMGHEPLFSRAERMVPIAWTGRAIPFRDLKDYFPSDRNTSATAYAQSGDFVRFLVSDKGIEAFDRYLELLGEGQESNDAMKAAFGKTLFDLETEWLKHVRRTYALVPLISGGAFLWFAMSVLFIFAYFKKRMDTKKKMQAMADREAWEREDIDTRVPEEEDQGRFLH